MSNLLQELRDELVGRQELLDNLTATQDRCKELLEENRVLKQRLADQEERWAQLLSGPATRTDPEIAVSAVEPTNTIHAVAKRLNKIPTDVLLQVLTWSEFADTRPNLSTLLTPDQISRLELWYGHFSNNKPARPRPGHGRA